MSDPRKSVPGSEKPVRRRRMMRVLRILACLAVLYVLWCVALFIFQDRLIFASHIARSPADEPPMAGAEVMSLGIDAGQRVVAWFIPAPGCNDQRPAPAVIYFHGNAEIIDDQGEVVRGYHRLGCSVLLPEYRRFGRSGGTPSQEAIRKDMVRFYDLIVQRADVDSSCMVFHGYSLGGAIATDLAGERTPSALILQSTFTSLPAMARRFGVPGFLARQRFETDRVIGKLSVPILILHGSGDLVIPVSHGRRLHSLAPSSQLLEFPRGHTDLPGRDHAARCWEAIRDLVNTACPRSAR